MKYPTWKLRGTPTPNETLWVCNQCETAAWMTDITGVNPPVCNNCRGRKGGQVRLRKATAAETAEAKKHLQEVIG